MGLQWKNTSGRGTSSHVETDLMYAAAAQLLIYQRKFRSKNHFTSKWFAISFAIRVVSYDLTMTNELVCLFNE